MFARVYLILNLIYPTWRSTSGIYDDKGEQRRKLKFTLDQTN